MKTSIATGKYTLWEVFTEKIDWRSPNTYVFLLVQVIGICWFLGLLMNLVSSTSSLALRNVIIIIAMIIARYSIGMWFVTAWRHRYFSHRSFKIAPNWKWIETPIAFICSADAQRGVCRWASEHIFHHQHSDDEHDQHSCKQKGIPTCHMFWVLFGRKEIDWALIPHLRKIKGIVWIEDRQWIGIVLGGGIFSAIGAFLSVGASDSFAGNFGFSLAMYFFCTTLLWHGTFLINSAMHLIGTQRYDTGDNSRNSLICAILTFGEGWHNNHHDAFPTLAQSRKLAEQKNRVRRKSSELFWQGETPFEKTFDWSGISIWGFMKIGVLQPLGAK